MNTKLLSVFCLVLFLCACGNRVENPENCDEIAITEYDNKYDDQDRLERAKITKTTYLFADKNRVKTNIEVSERILTCKENEDFTIEDISSDGNKREIVNFTDKTQETIRIENGTDTVYYYFWRDYAKLKPSYTRVKHGRDDISSDTDQEVYFHYDAAGREIRTVVVDNSSYKEEPWETWTFYDISFEEAKKKVPPSENEIKIVCYSTQLVGDTTITKMYANNELNVITKEVRNETGNLKLTFDLFGRLSFTDEEFEKDGYKITVRKSSDDETDSLFRKNDIVVRSVNINTIRKVATAWEYEKGHLLRQVTKTWFLAKEPE